MGKQHKDQWSKWDETTVSAWLKREGLGAYAKAFADAHISGIQLPDCSEEETLSGKYS